RGLFCILPSSKVLHSAFEELMNKLISLVLALSAVSSQSLADTSTATPPEMLALATTGVSRDEVLKLPTLVVTASREAESLSDSVSAVKVFTRADIDRPQPSSVVDLLRTVPCVHIAQGGGRGSASGLFIRGTSGAQSLVLIDGQRSA